MVFFVYIHVKIIPNDFEFIHKFSILYSFCNCTGQIFNRTDSLKKLFLMNFI